ncbi:HlyD family efflux transporter periplasmic adaptor subunit [Pseudooceanicola sp.]|uniref:efflux RND transporter periplasmic adaptor subunit n=1 Tax=Pseudooceanicola sp. TaxID=1914328 RepID=UPI002613E169|nr:HlyD family efflux transporter periplasmic adaptor subunit [Pseudooceanicola sp.]MDF1855340.1 HlyD family efflux transporter periplasmic adaptor subunit [Pseudooceanicola sp.]
MRFLRHSLTGLFLMSLTLGLLLYAGSLVFQAVSDRLAQDPKVPPARERVFTVNVVAAQPETITPILTAFGTVQSRRTLDIRSSSAGQVIELHDNFQNGGLVEAGAVLVRIDPVNAQSALTRAVTNLQDAEAAQRDAVRGLEIARDTLVAAKDQADLRDRAQQRQVGLRDRGVGTEAAVEAAELAASAARQAVLSARSALANAEARVDQAATALDRARLARDEAQRALDDTTITAEFSGTLSETAAVEGGLVSANERLAQLIDAEALETTFRVSTAQYARLLDDDGALRAAPVTVTLDVQGIGLTATGRISRASAAVGEGQVGRQVIARLDEARGLKPGDFVTVATEEPPLERVVRLPATAVDSAGTVLVVSQDDRLEVLEVQLERRQGDDVLVRGRGLAGRDVVRERSPLLGAGIKVRPIRPEAATAAPAAPAMVELSDERREKIRSFIEASTRLPDEVKTRILAQLALPEVPAQLIERLESRMGG